MGVRVGYMLQICDTGISWGKSLFDTFKENFTMTREQICSLRFNLVNLNFEVQFKYCKSLKPRL